jgi:hypothetical protein
MFDPIHQQWYYDHAFVPGYQPDPGNPNHRSGPYGVWGSNDEDAAVMAPWLASTDYHYDFGALVTQPNSAGTRLVDVVGGQGINCCQPHPVRVAATQFFYPGEARASCAGTTSDEVSSGAGPSALALPCALTGDPSGGPVLAGYNPASGAGSLISVAAQYRNTANPQVVGPYLSEQSWAPLYDWFRFHGLLHRWVPIGQRVGMQTGIQMQNTGTRPARVTLDYVGQDGRHAPAIPELTIAAGASRSVVDGAPSGFNGAAVIHADQPLAVVTNHVHQTYKLVASARGFAGGEQLVHLPLLMRANSGYDTWYSVQNTETNVQVQATITYRSARTSAAPSEHVTLQPGASWVFAQHGNTALAPLGPTFSAEVSATGKVAVTVMEESDTAPRLLGYDGFGHSLASQAVALPLVMAGNFGYWTGVQAQNVGGQATDVTITYGRNLADRPAGAGRVCDNDHNPATPHTPAPAVRRGVAAGRSATFLQLATDDPQFSDCTYVGSATVTAAQPLVAVANENGPTGGSAYEGFDPARLSGTLDIPLLRANHYGASSGVQIQNAGTVRVHAELVYGPNTVPGCDSGRLTRRPFDLDPGQAVKFQQGPGDPRHEFDTCTYLGSARVERASTGARLGAIVNQLGGSYQDDLSTYAVP